MNTRAYTSIAFLIIVTKTSHKTNSNIRAKNAHGNRMSHFHSLLRSFRNKSTSKIPETIFYSISLLKNSHVFLLYEPVARTQKSHSGPLVATSRNQKPLALPSVIIGLNLCDRTAHLDSRRLNHTPQLKHNQNLL